MGKRIKALRNALRRGRMVQVLHPGAPAELRAFFRWRGDSYAHYHAKQDERWTAWAQVHNVAVVLFVHAPRDLAVHAPRDLAADLLQEPAVEVSR